MLVGDDEADPGLMFAIISVPRAVPSLFHSSTPFVGSLAVKNRVSVALIKLAGEEFGAPKLISSTITVPGPVPSLFQSSFPVNTEPVAENKTMLLISVILP